MNFSRATFSVAPPPVIHANATTKEEAPAAPDVVSPELQRQPYAMWVETLHAFLASTRRSSPCTLAA